MPCDVRVAGGERVRQGGLARPSPRCTRPPAAGGPPVRLCSNLGRRPRPGGLAAGRSVPAVVPARAPQAAGGLLQSGAVAGCPSLCVQWRAGGRRGGGAVLRAGACRGGILGCWPVPSLPPAVRGPPTGHRVIVVNCANGCPCCPRCCRHAVRGRRREGGLAIAGAGGGGAGQRSAVIG